MCNSISDVLSAFSLDACPHHLGCQDLIRKLWDFSSGCKILWFLLCGAADLVLILGQLSRPSVGQTGLAIVCSPNIPKS